MNQPTDTTSCALGRRKFLASASALGAAGFFGTSRSVAAEPPPETTRIRVVYDGSICLAPEWLAEDLLRLEGFSEVEYVSSLAPGLTPSSVLVAGHADVGLRFYGVRLHELGMIKSTPQKLISQGTDWRFLNELKQELKA